MYWLVAGLFVLGAVCGATIRLMVFIVVLLGAASIAIVVGMAHGLGEGALHALIAVICLQLGYAAGFVLRAAIRSPRSGTAARAEQERPLPAPLGEKRR
jgi:hypothetical protein